jgi:hypothetical protein
MRIFEKAALSRTSTRIARLWFALALTSFAVTPGFAQQSQQKRPWEGYAILGSGRLTAVYSDDSRITARTHARGIQLLYFRDYTADYVSSTLFEVLNNEGKVVAPRDDSTPQIGMKNFFTTQTTAFYPDASMSSALCFVHPGHIAVVSLELTGGWKPSKRFRFEARLRKEVEPHSTITLTYLRKVNNVAYANWSNGTVLAIASWNPHDRVAVGDSFVSVTGTVARSNSKAVVLLVPGSSRAEALKNLKSLQKERDVEESTGLYWNAWMS